MGKTKREGGGIKHSLIQGNVILLHFAPVAPLEGDDRGPAVNLEDLPGESGHHALEGLVTRGEVGAARAVPGVGRADDGVVRADLEHVLGGLRRPAVDGKRVDLRVHGPPVAQIRLERGLDLPVLD